MSKTTRQFLSPCLLIAITLESRGVKSQDCLSHILDFTARVQIQPLNTPPVYRMLSLLTNPVLKKKQAMPGYTDARKVDGNTADWPAGALSYVKHGCQCHNET